MTDKRVLNMVSVTVNDKARDWLEVEALRVDRPMTWVIRRAIEGYMEAKKKTRGRPKKVG